MTKNELAEKYGVAEGHFLDLMYEMAYDRGHTFGVDEIEAEFAELVPLWDAARSAAFCKALDTAPDIPFQYNPERLTQLRREMREASDNWKMEGDL